MGGMIKKMKIGIKGIHFDAAHYTLGSESKCESLHGHTFELDVELEGDVDESTGMIMDFAELKKLVKEVISEYDHKVIVPKEHLNQTVLSGKFKTEIKVLDSPHATTEYIALSILSELRKKVRGRISIRLYEGRNNYVEVSTDDLEQSLS
ncbi:MAG: 6-pyruvoyl trahydropterin synthase family protein [Fervidicoccaceae archaeon]